MKFFDHPSGNLYISAPSGGGMGNGSVFEAPATKNDIEKNPKEYAAYLRLKQNGSVELDNAPTDLQARDIYIRDLERQLRVARAEIERLNGIIRVHSG